MGDIGGGNFTCPGCDSTTFTPGSTNGTIYLIQEAGTNNWAGYIMEGNDSSGNGHFSEIQSYITIPGESSFSGPSGSEAAFWIGLGGWTETGPSYPFWQAGVTVTLPDTISLWYEGFQSSTDWEDDQPVTSNVTFGSVIELFLEFTSGGRGYVCFTLIHWEYCTYDSILSGDSSAYSGEWVAEAPSNSNEKEYILPDFGPAIFSKMELTPNEGQFLQQALQTCWNGQSCGDSGQTVTPPPFYTGDFARGFNLTYSGST